MAAKRIIVGVAGGIAAYKACTLVRQLTEAGHSVRVVPTESALRFVGAATFEALSGNPVQTGVFESIPEVPHVRLGQSADLVVIAPATADRMAQMAAGLAGDLAAEGALQEPRLRAEHTTAVDVDLDLLQIEDLFDRHGSSSTSRVRRAGRRSRGR